MRYAFAGDRAISVEILKFIMDKGFSPLALLVTADKNTTNDIELVKVSELPENKVFRGKAFNSVGAKSFLEELELDYIIGIHFPYIISEEVLNIPRIGFLNLHPSFLPYNKGWNTPSWAILDNKPYGATLHFMTKALDAGDIIHQKSIEIKPYETANTLYQRVLELEKTVFYEAFNQIISLKPTRKVQKETGTSYNKKDLKVLQQIDVNEVATYGEIINKLRALTTNNIDEAAYIVDDDDEYAVQIHFIKKENEK